MSYATKVDSCVIYARLSVTKEESVSIERQLESCRRYAEARGWKIVGEYIDDGVSASVNKPEDRKGWASLLAARGFEAVVIWKVDRLARRVLDFLHADEALRDRGAGLVAVEDPIDMTSPQGRAFAVMLAVFGEMEAEAIRARVRAARAHLIKDGRWTGGGIPYGYQAIDNPAGPGRVLAKDPDRIGWLEQIAQRALDGETVNGITTWLTDAEAPVPGRRKAGSTRWNRQTVEGLLRNPTLAGMTPYNPGRGKSAAGKVDPFAVVRDEHGHAKVNPDLAVLSVDEFRQLQQMLDNRSTPQSRPMVDRQRTSLLLSKVARCDDCDVWMHRGTNQGRPTLYCPDCRQTISRTRLDPWITRRLLRRSAEPFEASTVGEEWKYARDDERRREILLSQLESLRIRRDVVGRQFDDSRVLIEWREPAEVAS